MPALQKENNMDDLDSVSYDDLLDYARKLAQQIRKSPTKDDTADKESLAMWISNNEPNYNPEDD